MLTVISDPSNEPGYGKTEELHGFIETDRLDALRILQFGEFGLFLIVDVPDLHMVRTAMRATLFFPLWASTPNSRSPLIRSESR